MLQEPAEELLTREGDAFHELRLVVPVVEGDFTVPDRFDPAVTDRDPVDVASEVGKDRFPASCMLAVDDPAFSPDIHGNTVEQVLPAQGITELGAEDNTEGPCREQVALALWVLPVSFAIKTSCGNEEVDVRVIGHGPGPGVKDAHEGGGGAKVVGIKRELLDRGGGSLHQDVVEAFLMGAGERPQLLGKSGGNEEVGAGEHARALFLEPAFGSFLLAFGAVAILAGMVAVVLAPAVLARVDVASEVGRPAALDIFESSAMTGQEFLPEALPVRRAMEADDVRHLRHRRVAGGLKIVHQSVNGRNRFTADYGRQVGVDGRCGRAAVSQEFLNDT